MEIFTIFPSSWHLATIFVSIFCIFLYTLKSNKSSMSARYKLPPNPPKLPIIGNLHQLIGKSRPHALCQLSHQYGPVMLLYIGSKPFLVISSSAMAKQVLKTQDHIFCSRTLFQGTKRMTYNYSDIAFSPYTNHWREMRKILVSEFLGPKRAKLFSHALVAEIETMLASLSSNTGEVDLSKVFLEVVKAVVCKVAFGKNYKEQPLIQGSTLDVMLRETLEMFNGSLGDSFPWLGRMIDHFSGFNGRLEKCFSDFDAYIEAIIVEHENHAREEISDDDKDFVHTILELSSKANASDYRLTKQDMKALVMDVLTGGIDTTVLTLVWAMSEIARSGRVMQKLQNEIRNCTGRIEKVKEIDISKMRYLKMVVKETLRLHPPAPLLIPHESLSHCKIGGYDVFPKTTVLINGWGIGRDPNTWGENAAEFYPERFEDIVKVDFEMIPFGGGRRSCPATNTAPATVEMVIANLVYWFDWKVVGTNNDESLNMEEQGSLVARKKFPLRLVPTKHIS